LGIRAAKGQSERGTGGFPPLGFYPLGDAERQVWLQRWRPIDTSTSPASAHRPTRRHRTTGSSLRPRRSPSAAGGGGLYARGQECGQRSSIYLTAPSPSHRARRIGSSITHSVKLLTTEPYAALSSCAQTRSGRRHRRLRSETEVDALADLRPEARGNLCRREGRRRPFTGVRPKARVPFETMKPTFCARAWALASRAYPWNLRLQPQVESAEPQCGVLT
jgi:hypothetical protein